MKARIFYIIFFLFLINIHARVELWEPHFQAHPVLEKRIHEWIALLQSQDQNNNIIENIRQIGKIAYPYLKDALERGDDKTQKKIIEIFAHLKLEDSIDLLLNILQKENLDPRVRESAAMALGEFHQAKIHEILIKFAFHRDNRISRAASYALCRKPSRQSIPYLITLLKHWDETIRNKAHLMLSQITNQSKIASNFDAWQRWWNNYQDIFEESKS